MAVYSYKLGISQKHLVFRDNKEVDRLGFRMCNNKNHGKAKNNMMLEGVDLGEIMKQMMLEDLRLIKLENGETIHRMLKMLWKCQEYMKTKWG